MNFDLETFLRNYKSAKMDFSEYLELEKMVGYRMINKGYRKELERMKPR